MEKDVKAMTDDELSALVDHDDLVAAAREELERRKAERDPSITPLPASCVRGITDAPCPACGRNDAVIESKTMYGTPELAHGGEPIGTMCFCSCRTWYDAKTGKYVNPCDVYTY